MCLAATAVAAAALCTTAQAASFRDGFTTRNLAYVQQAIDVDWAPDGRMFIAAKPGRVYVVDPDSGTEERKILDISSHVNSYSDRGLEGIAVDSDFERNHYLWLLYVHEPNGEPQSTRPRSSRLTRVTVHDSGTSKETVVLGRSKRSHCSPPKNGRDCIPADSRSHMVGTVRSAPDGTLWVGSGDASNDEVLDPQSLRAYDVRSYAGKILHVDRSGRGIPGHPFCRPKSGRDNLRRVCAKVYARGLRAPYRFTLRPGGGLIVGDVGWATREEINFVSAGRNYGWPCYEGGAGTARGAKEPQWRHKSACSGRNGWYSRKGSHRAIPPVFDYAHHGKTAAIIGGPQFPGGGGYPGYYSGKIFFGDFPNGTIRTYNPATRKVRSFASGVGVTDIEIAPNGRIVYVDIGAEAVNEIVPPAAVPR